MTQPGNAPKDRPSHLTTVNAAFSRSLWRTCLQGPQRPGPLKDADSELRHSSWLYPSSGAASFEGQSSLRSISWLRHSMFYPHVTISAAQAHESDDLHHTMSLFSTFLSSFFGRANNLGICEATKDSSGASSKKREKKEHLEEPSNRDSHRELLWRNWLLWRMQTLNWDTAAVVVICRSEGRCV